MKLHHKCGVFGIYGHKPVAPHIYLSLMALQHRGQESAGIALDNEKKIKIHKDMGLVADVFPKSFLNNTETTGIGHVRYSTTGSSSLNNAHPLFIENNVENFAIAHNGNIINTEDLASQFNISFKDHITDTEIVGEIIKQNLEEEKDLSSAVKNTLPYLEGSYSFVILGEDKILGVRDPMGMRPLQIGESEDGDIALASESVAFDTLNMRLLRDVEPGEIVSIIDGQRESRTIKRPSFCLQKRAFCMFEFIYFARPDAILEGKSVYSIRGTLGKLLAEQDDHDIDVVSGVPDSGISYSMGYAQAHKKTLSECLIKNRYIGRTFIKPEQDSRELGVRVKLNPVHSRVRNRRLTMIDDSIVRGTTSRKIMNVLKRCDPKEIHLRIACPPIISPCFYGIDFPSQKELIANKKSEDQIRDFIGVDSLRYQLFDDFISGIGIKERDLCLGCLTGQYPTESAHCRMCENNG